MEKFFKKWWGLAQRLLASIGSQASLLALVLVFVPPSTKFEGWFRTIILFAILLAAVSVWLEIRSEKQAHKHRKTYDRADTSGIKAYMGDWIGNSGRAAIWTRDLSWANDDAIKTILISKAAHGNLTVCMPKMNDIGKTLEAAGAKVCIYGDQGFDLPASRFTIAYSGNGGTKVAIGRTNGDLHVIEEIDSSDPALHMAQDLIALAQRLEKRGSIDA